MKKKSFLRDAKERKSVLKIGIFSYDYGVDGSGAQAVNSACFDEKKVCLNECAPWKIKKKRKSKKILKKMKKVEKVRAKQLDLNSVS